MCFLCLTKVIYVSTLSSAQLQESQSSCLGKHTLQHKEITEQYCISILLHLVFTVLRMPFSSIIHLANSYTIQNPSYKGILDFHRHSLQCTQTFPTYILLLILVVKTLLLFGSQLFFTHHTIINQFILNEDLNNLMEFTQNLISKEVRSM